MKQHAYRPGNQPGMFETGERAVAGLSAFGIAWMALAALVAAVVHWDAIPAVIGLVLVACALQLWRYAMSRTP